MTHPRRFPPPSSVDDLDMKLGQDCFIVRDAHGQALAYVYSRTSRAGFRRHISSHGTSAADHCEYAKLPDLLSPLELPTRLHDNSRFLVRNSTRNSFRSDIRS
jgi:hypothetical protein